ncbi:hypothetical protein QTJ16_002095 [Diplocarpon rosae]|uniref:Uncharacterized protein n=1 Tax=Diplocarpon rosae TaxID=946125 RepID=A0AAD9T4R8_9HELO|nr:hypothetical protein QTJ16_002095 [Diplocarpon rosae]
MVILGGLELVAAGYIIHKHLQNKKERQRLEDEAAALEEEHTDEDNRLVARRIPRIANTGGTRAQGNSHQPRGHQLRTGAPRRRRNHFNGRIPPPQPLHQALAPQRLPQPYPQPRPEIHYPLDVKYEWTHEEESAKPPRQHDLGDSPTGGPPHWEQMNTSTRRAESSRGRRGRMDSPPVEFGPSRDAPSVRSANRSPPPSYTAY